MARLTLTFFSGYLAVQTIHHVSIAVMRPETKFGQLMTSGGPPARIGFAILTLLCLVALVDCIGTAIAPVAGWARKGLHGWIWRLLCLGQAWQGYVAIHAGIEPVVAAVFFWCAAAAGSIAYLDLRERAQHRGASTGGWNA